LFKLFWARCWALVGQTLTVRYFVFDGAFGHNQALQMVRRTGLELISKLRHNSALYLPYDGPYAGRGPRRKYGRKLDINTCPQPFSKPLSWKDIFRRPSINCRCGTKNSPTGSMS
jgi:hypothetical protein